MSSIRGHELISPLRTCLHLPDQVPRLRCKSPCRKITARCVCLQDGSCYSYMLITDCSNLVERQLRALREIISLQILPSAAEGWDRRYGLQVRLQCCPCFAPATCRLISLRHPAETQQCGPQKRESNSFNDDRSFRVMRRSMRPAISMWPIRQARQALRTSQSSSPSGVSTLDNARSPNVPTRPLLTAANSHLLMARRR